MRHFLSNNASANRTFHYRMHAMNSIRTFITADSNINFQMIIMNNKIYLNEFRYEFSVDIRAYVWLKMIWQHPIWTRPLSQFHVHDHCYLARANQIQPYMHHRLFQPLTFWRARMRHWKLWNVENKTVDITTTQKMHSYQNKYKRNIYVYIQGVSQWTKLDQRGGST